MARAIRRKSFSYEVNSDTILDTRVFNCLISMDTFNVSDAAKKIKPSSQATTIPFHIYVDKNEKIFGISPRKFKLEYVPEIQGNGSCILSNPKRYVEIPVLTILQFTGATIYDPTSSDAQEDTKIIINHSADGSSELIYRIIAKIPQTMI